MGANRDDGGHAPPEYLVDYGFTKDLVLIHFDTFKFRGVMRMLPGRIELFRTWGADAEGVVEDARNPFRFGWILGFYALLVRLFQRKWTTKATPDHTLPGEGTHLMYDERRDLILLQPPGTFWLVVKVASQQRGRKGSKRFNCLEDLEHALGEEAFRFRSKMDWRTIAMVVIALTFLAVLVYLFCTI